MASEFDSSMKAYMKEIAKTPLLTPEDEITLSKRIKKGDQAAGRQHDFRLTR
jgi:RNA polymerase primary sigma factor